MFSDMQYFIMCLELYFMGAQNLNLFSEDGKSHKYM